MRVLDVPMSVGEVDAALVANAGSPVSQPLVSERVARLRPDVMTRERMTCTEHPGILAALVHGASHEGTRCVGARDIQRQG